MTTTIADAARSHTFGRSRPFQVGVEEELFLADPRTLQVVHRADEVLARRRFARGKVLGEICDGMIELVTPPCPSPGQARRHLGDLRRKVLAGGDVVLLGTGVHPTTPFAAVVPRRGRYYEEIMEASGDLLRQTAYCGVHVHVGLPDPETAVTALNGMRKWVPLLQALSANSPFWHDRDSGLASARSARCAGMPRTGLPRRFADWADYAATVDDLCRVGELPGPSAIWWDVRLQPRLGTLEVRCLDAQSSLAELGSLVALVQGLVRHEATDADAAEPGPELLAEAGFRAVRDGVRARLPFDGALWPVPELAAHAVDLASAYAPALACTEELAGVHRLAREGNGAERQRRAHAAGGLPAVLRLLAQETATTDAAA